MLLNLFLILSFFPPFFFNYYFLPLQVQPNSRRGYVSPGRAARGEALSVRVNKGRLSVRPSLSTSGKPRV